MAEAQSSRKPHSISKQQRKKLAKLPQNAKVSKRPLLRPAIPSPYTGSSQQKVVYISSHTPFLSAVKRVEKLLHLADERLVQSATTSAKHQNGRGVKRKRGADGDEIFGIAEEVEKLKGKKKKNAGSGVDGDDEDAGAGEEVVLKGTGKAIHRVLELALWFQQREQEYVVKLRTGSVGAIDDISVEEKTNSAEKADADEAGKDILADADDTNDMDVDGAEGGGVQVTRPDMDGRPHTGRAGDNGAKKGKRKRSKEMLAADDVPETRIRYTSVLEAAVSLR